MFFYDFTEKEKVILLVNGVQVNICISLCSLPISHKDNSKGFCYKKTNKTKKRREGKAESYKDKEHGRGQRQQWKIHGLVVTDLAHPEN